MAMAWRWRQISEAYLDPVEAPTGNLGGHGGPSGLCLGAEGAPWGVSDKMSLAAFSMPPVPHPVRV